MSEGIWERILGWTVAAAAAESHQSCPTLCDPTDGSPPGILQAFPSPMHACILSRFSRV